MASPKMILKLLVDKKGQKVMFAETSKDFVDFLFQIFSLPLGTLIEFLGSEQMVGCLGKLKESIDSFNSIYLQPGIEKDDIFHPKTAFNGTSFLLSYDAGSGSGSQSGGCKSIYRCSNALQNYYEGNRGSCLSNVTHYPNAKCPGCNGTMNNKTTIVLPQEEAIAEAEEAETRKKMKGGYVKEVVTYMVMDDLVVKPMSTISSITLINSFNINDMSQLEEKTVSFGKDEAMKLLKASLTTDKVLTTLFLLNNHV